MKKIYIALLALGATLLSSCVQEKNFKDITVGENEIAFVMQGVSTRSAEEGSAYVTKGITIPMGEIEGEALYLEETIEELNPSPATKGAPVYTTTLPDVYPTMGVYAAGNFGDASFEMMDKDMYPRKGSETDKGWRYHHNYNANPWPSEGAVDFYLRMPEGEAPAAESSTTEEGPFVYTANTHSFKLTSPLNGKEQDDILFGHVQMTKEQHDKQLPNGYPVTMMHALSGIKFANGHPNGTQTKTIITKVELIGLNKYGEGTINADGTVTWKSGVTAQLSTEQTPFYLQFDNPEYVKTAGASNPDGTVGSDDWNDGLQNTSWTTAAADKNLNHANGELTFWFIPQEVPDNLILKVYFTVKTPDSVDGFTNDACHVIKFGELLNNKYQSVEGNSEKNLKWEAGQLRTYTVMPYDVDVDIIDNISETIKSDLHVANTGNVDEYVRMLIMGNWYGWKPGDDQSTTEPSILVGYKYKDEDDLPTGLTDTQKEEYLKEMILPWYREGYPHKGGVYYATEAKAIENGWAEADGYKDPYGVFDESFPLADLTKAKINNVPKDRDGQPDDWADASGGFYYTMPIGPGEVLSASSSLFQTYTVTDVPTIYIATNGTAREAAVGVHLVMEIVVQAIPVPKDAQGNPVWWLEAWHDATGVNKLAPDYTSGSGKTPNKKYKDIFDAGLYTGMSAGPVVR